MQTQAEGDEDDKERDKEANSPLEIAATFASQTQALESYERIVDTWSDSQRQTVNALRETVDALHREALRKIISVCRAQAGEALRDLLQDEYVYSVLRHLEIIRPSITERIEEALNEVRPSLASHGGDVELVSVEPPNSVTIRLLGACDGCPASSLTLSEGVEKAIRAACPEITDIQVANGFSALTSVRGDTVGARPLNFVSPFANPHSDDWQYAALASEVPELGIKLANVEGQNLLLSKVSNTLVCYEDMCAHMGMPISSGQIIDGQLECPHHGLRFLLSTGECTTIKEIQLKTRDVRVRDDVVEVAVR